MLSLVALWLLVPSCCFMPKTVEPESLAGVQPCKLTTKKLALDVYQPEEGLGLAEAMMRACDGRDTGPECAIVVLSPAAVSVGSLVVSGSIVVIGNSIHWIEAQGRCEESLTRRSARKLISAARQGGGMIIGGTADLINFFVPGNRDKQKN